MQMHIWLHKFLTESAKLMLAKREIHFVLVFIRHRSLIFKALYFKASFKLVHILTMPTKTPESWGWNKILGGFFVDSDVLVRNVTFQ